MEELFELKSHVEQGRYAEALTLIGEMEEMSRMIRSTKSKVSLKSCSFT